MLPLKLNSSLYRTFFAACFIATALFGCNHSGEHHENYHQDYHGNMHDHNHHGEHHNHHGEDQANDEITELQIKNLLREQLEITEGIEVITSYLEVPKNTALPLHYHPGEEFIYMLSGSGEVTLQGDTTLILRVGEAFKIPMKKVHSFTTLDETASAVVFRVHEEGQPDRILVEEEEGEDDGY